MKNLFLPLIAVLLAAIGLSSTSNRATYIVGVPGAMGTDTAETVLKSVVKLLDTGASGDEVRVYDAWSGQLMGGFTIPDSKSVKARRTRTKAEMGEIVSKLKRASSVRSGQEGEVRLPQFLQLVSSGLRSGGGDVRVLVFGGPYYADARDKGFTFGDGLYPSDGHILAEPAKSVFGTAGWKDRLSGCAVHLCYFGVDRFKGDPRSLEINAVKRFWHLYVSELGGVLATFEASEDHVLGRAMSGVKDPVLPDKIDHTDTAIEMRRVGMPAANGSETKPMEAAAPKPTQERSPAPHYLILIDGSASMEQVLADTTSMVKTAARTGASLCGEIKIGIIVYRGPGETDVLPLTTVRRQVTAEPDEGMRTFLDFLEAENVRLEDATAPGGFRMVTRMHPRNCAVDVAAALRTGLDLLKGSASKEAPLLVALCGDQGPFELENLSTVEPEELRLANTLQEEVRAFAQSFPKAAILSVYTGSESTRQHNQAESKAFFRGAAEVAGQRGTFTEDTATLLTKALAMFERSLK